MEKKCEQVLMARGAISEVMYCRSCRVFHVNVDAVTVHFEVGALRDLRDTVAAALAAQEHIAPEKAEGTAPTRARVKLMH
jgi:hypothetical protein